VNATEQEDDQRTTPGREIWRNRCVEQDTNTLYSWGKMEAAAQNRAKDNKGQSEAKIPPGTTRLQQATSQFANKKEKNNHTE